MDRRPRRWHRPRAVCSSGDDGSGLRAAGTATPIQNYPGHLLNHFDPDYGIGVGDNADGGPNLAPVVPIALYGGLLELGGVWMPLYFAQFASGALTPLGGAHAGMTTTMGQPSVQVMFDPTEGYEYTVLGRQRRP